MRSLSVLAVVALMYSILSAQQPSAPLPDKLVYADFENSTADHVTSSRGGITQTVGWQEKDALAPTVEPYSLNPTVLTPSEWPSTTSCRVLRNTPAPRL